MKLLLKGGKTVSPKGAKNADILIENEKIAEVGKDIKCDDAETIDVSGKLIFPGFIDAHTHFDLEVAGTVTADDFESGSKSALAGGTTTIIDFATQNAGETLKYGYEHWVEKSKGKTSCDYGFHMAISEWNENVKKEIPQMIKKGITSFKVYMTYSNMVSDEEIFDILKTVNKYGGIVGVHCESDGIIKALVKEKKAAKQNGVSSHPLTRPALAEAEAINRLSRIAEAADVPVIVVHLSTEEGYKEIMAARKRGVKIYAETCPQYLALDDSVYFGKGFSGAKYVCAPPLRKETDSECLWKALKKGDINTVSTDHCSFTLKQKKMGKGDFTKIPGGMPGAATRAGIIYTYGVCGGKITLGDMVRLMSENPAKLYGIYPKKGVIEAGSDADLVIFDPDRQKKITAKDTLSKAGYTPFEGVIQNGVIEAVYLRGEKVYDGKEVVKPYRGKFLKRSTEIGI